MPDEQESQFQTGSVSPFDAKLFPRALLSAEQVEQLHRNADTDQRVESIHHTVGTSRLQAAPGDHNHKDSGVPIFDGYVFTGSRSTNTASVLDQILNMLQDFGATDSTTA